MKNGIRSIALVMAFVILFCAVPFNVKVNADEIISDKDILHTDDDLLSETPDVT